MDVSEVVALLDECCIIPAIVEGPHDASALKELGFFDVYTLQDPMYVIVERFEKKDVVQILTDFDVRGVELYASIRSELLQRGVRIDDRLRLAIKQTGVTHIEELAVFIQRRT